MLNFYFCVYTLQEEVQEECVLSYILFRKKSQQRLKMHYKHISIILNWITTMY